MRNPSKNTLKRFVKIYLQSKSFFEVKEHNNWVLTLPPLFFKKNKKGRMVRTKIKIQEKSHGLTKLFNTVNMDLRKTKYHTIR